MASRRQKFKPLAGIQKARRAQSTASESITKNLIKSELPLDIISVKIEDAKKEETPVPAENRVETNLSESVSDDIQAKSPEISEQTEEKPQITTAPRPLRRSIKPAVVIPDRRRKIVQPVEVKAEENNEKSPVTESGEKSPRKAVTAAAAPLAPLKLKQENADNIQKPLTPDDTFKSPFLSPSVQSAHQKRSEFTYNPLEQQNSVESLDDPTKSPVYSNKVRQRIRPTPYFGRRNSVQGAVSESDDESSKRQRHLSTSSNHSNYNINNNLTQKGENIRMRTESVCSNASEAAFQTFSKPKRIARSEEFQRIANAKKEFHQRFNGKTPDKQHLTMYDMIYYNPITNPLKNPAAKPIDVKDRRSSSASSVHSVASIRSIKSEAKTSEDSIETEMPVPQLKLVPNGEIVLDEKSLVIETTGDKEARETLANADIVYDDEFSGSTGFYKRQKRTREWDANETIKFYRCLHSVGTDFSLMLMQFPNRSRRDLKLKFKKEEKTNLNLINKALLHPKEFNIDDLKIDLEREEKELEQKKLEWEELKQKHAREKREQARLLKQKNRKSIAARNLAGSDSVYDHEFAIASRKNRKEMMELQRKLDHDAKLQQFFGIKGQRRTNADLEIREANKKVQIQEQLEQQISNYQNILDNIKTLSGESQIANLTSYFSKQEEENFALFNNVNELSYEVETLNESVQLIQDDIDKQKGENESKEKSQMETIETLEQESLLSKEKADEAKQMQIRIENQLRELLQGVEHIFGLIGRGDAPILELLKTQKVITPYNVKPFLGIIKRQTNQIINCVHITEPPAT